MLLEKQLKATDFKIYVLEMGFGEVGKEPIDNVHFYSKSDLKTAFKTKKYQVSSLKPEKFHEFLVRVYYDPADQKHQREVQQKAEKCFHEWCKNPENTFIDCGNSDSGKEDDDDDDEDEEEEENEKTSSSKIFNDPIHGHIELPHLLVKIIDTPQFQRLRHIKQLGGAYLVYPGATHTRFEHSLGMAHLAGSLLKVLREKQEKCIEKIEKDIKKLGKKQEKLKKKQEELNEKKNELITEKDMLCVQIAALCYNLGHGPFSHLFEKFIHKAWPGGRGDDQQPGPSEEKWKVASIWIFLDIVRNEGLNTELTNKDLTFIQTLIEGDYKAAQENKSFLYEIVANNWNGIDVRRWEYFARDCHYLGISNSFDHQRMLKSAQVCKVNGTNHICFRDKVADNIYDMFHTRYTLYQQAYQHKIVNITENKIIKALLEAKDRLEISPISEYFSPDEIKQKIKNITSSSQKRKMPPSEDEKTAKFIKLTDHIFEKILYSSDDKLKDARKELEDVVMRRLRKCVGETRLKETEEKEVAFKDDWNKAVDEWNKLHPNLVLHKKDFSTEVILLDYNKGAEKGVDPINSVYFYRKKQHNKGRKIRKYEVSSLLPKKFSEHVGRVYYTKNSDEEEMDAKECFKWWRLGMCVIELYDQHAFRGTKCVITGNCPSLDRCSITEVRSCKVIRGVWKLWKGRDSGDDYLLTEGEYPNLKALSDGKSTASATAPAPVPDPAWSLECLPFTIQLYEKVNFEGPNFETTVDCPSLNSCGINEVRSCKVLSGVWDLYEGPDYAKPSYQLQKGEYPNPEAWGNGNTAPAQSVKRVTSYKIQLYEKEDFEERMHETTVDRRSLDGCGINEVRSCKVLSGVWDLYEGPEYAEPNYQLKEGEYPNPEAWCASDPTAPALSVKRVTE
ncbi:deoxynucleoside triphosphate triphosphohydrolase SAMHD1-like [Sinocyclocheilus rhinocerous]|uniref:deoxynucleoside triphosphate triphosphohydrolase SAMHD1-like n=1 Tax=Sinocyclocheilus rhinocerous TaxID=307959 RepID=UPI0007B8B775|nr:PREDICTED: deoxynucleoside triphosphate triphosphohydrolase SAMHD1-like [Sinocyclocheilus rhinocerous]